MSPRCTNVSGQVRGVSGPWDKKIDGYPNTWQLVVAEFFLQVLLSHISISLAGILGMEGKENTSSGHLLSAVGRGRSTERSLLQVNVRLNSC